MNDKVGFLAHRNKEADTDYIEFLSCSHCKNKTYKVTYNKESEFPLMSCAACGSFVGYFGWVNEENI